MKPFTVPDKTDETVARFTAAVERDYEARRLAGELCRAIETSGEKCTAPTNGSRLWCDFHMGLIVDDKAE